MAPPQLPADAPVAQVLVPGLEGLRVAVRREAQRTVAFGRRQGLRGRGQRAFDLLGGHRAKRRAREARIGHPHVPLVAEPRLDRHVASVAVADRVLVLADLLEQPVRAEPLDHLRAGVLAREPDERPRVVGDVAPAVAIGDRAIGAEHVDHREIVAAPDLPVVGVVRGRDLEEARREGGLRIARLAAKRRGHHHVVVLDDWDDATDDRKPHALATQRRGAGIPGVHRDRGVAEHRLRTCRRDDDEARPILERVLEVVHAPGDGAHLDLVVGEGRLRRWIPVDEPLAPVDEAFGEEAEERGPHRGGADRVHREAGALEVAGAAEVLELRDDRRLVLVLPRLHAFDEALAAEILPAGAFAQQPLLDDGLRGDAGVVGAGHPQRVEALHPLAAGEHVLQRVVEGVSEMERRRHVGRRDQDRKRRLARVPHRIGVKAPRVAPCRADDRFARGGQVGFLEARRACSRRGRGLRGIRGRGRFRGRTRRR